MTLSSMPGQASLLLVVGVATLFLLSLPIQWVIKSLKKEREGCIQITEAAQELNSKTLHEAGENLFKSNKLKYQAIIAVFVQALIAGVIWLVFIFS